MERIAKVIANSGYTSRRKAEELIKQGRVYVNDNKVMELGLKYEVVRDGYRIQVPNTQEATKLILKYPHIFVDYEVTKGKMDDVFLAVTGKKLVGGME